MFIYFLLLCVQIITESLPISSSGHVKLLELLFPTVVLPKLLEYAAHVPTAVIIPLFFKEQLRFLTSYSWKQIFWWIFSIGLADVLTSCFYLLFIYYPPTWMPLWLGFGISSLLLLTTWFVTSSTQKVSMWHIVSLGLVQGIALMPGISRFASTFAAARCMGLSVSTAVQLSFALQWPLIAAAAAYGLTKTIYLYKRVDQLLYPMLFGLLACSIVAYYVFAYVVQLLEKQQAWIFGVYLIIPCIIAFFLT